MLPKKKNSIKVVVLDQFTNLWATKDLFLDLSISHLSLLIFYLPTSGNPTSMIFWCLVGTLPASWKCLCPVMALRSLSEGCEDRNVRTCQMCRTVVIAFKMKASSLPVRLNWVCDWIERVTELSVRLIWMLWRQRELWTSYEQYWWFLVISTWPMKNYDGFVTHNN